MTTMRVIAKAGDYEVIQDANGVVSIHFGSGVYICDHGSAYEAIRECVKDSDIRNQLLQQWSNDMAMCNRAEKQSEGRS